MKVVTLRQPEATAVVLGVVKQLWRGRSLVYRGPLLIHAGKRVAGNAPPPRDLVCNALLGVVDLVACVRKDHRGADPDEAAYFWVLANPRVFATPYPYNGKPGMFQVADQVVAAALAGVPPRDGGGVPLAAPRP